ncbi:MAG: glycosyltransferase family 2 protein [Actinobacteria bacterium]|nr:glycosyltransferase family 2 protein [Actinomycetota bacterium]MBI3687958.1 glycosyltransferase family 2 protein [Actinomycetota bacterium]
MTHQHRLGLPSARNTGIEHDCYWAFLDDDDLFLPTHLATALAGLESGVDAVATTCLVSEHRVDPTNPVPDAITWDVEFDPLLLEACNLFPVRTAVGEVPPVHRHHVPAGPRAARHRCVTPSALLPAFGAGTRTRLA